APKVTDKRPLHVYGLVAGIERSFAFVNDAPVWQTWIHPDTDGEKHPAGRVLTERLQRAHTVVFQAVVRLLNQAVAWPVLRTELDGEDMETLRRLHRLSDWVVTIDRNAGLEYFDSPRDARAVYDAYVIDAVPE